MSPFLLRDRLARYGKLAAAYLLAYLLPPRLMRTKEVFRRCERRGYHVTPVHFYEPIPDTRALREELWAPRTECPGVELNDADQRRLLSLLSSRFRAEYEALPRKPTREAHQYFVHNPYFGPVDGEMLYSIVRHFRPQRFFEIGSGFSTRLAAQAILRNQQENDSFDAELVAIEPYPDDVLARGFPGLSKVVRMKVEDVDAAFFGVLERNDILFIDSSHVLKTGGDVQREYLEILPSLRPGVLVHIHDIFLPSEYPREWLVRHLRFWNEQYVLHAFLAFNESFRVVWGSSYMHLVHADLLDEAFSSYDRRTASPGSFWIRRRK